MFLFQLIKSAQELIGVCSSHIFRGMVHMSPRLLSTRVLVAVSFFLLAEGPALAQDHYFLLMFASQRTPPNPNHAHTFATFVHVQQNALTPGIPLIESHTISWLPANLIIRIGALLPEE